MRPRPISPLRRRTVAGANSHSSIQSRPKGYRGGLGVATDGGLTAPRQYIEVGPEVRVRLEKYLAASRPCETLRVVADEAITAFLDEKGFPAV